MRSLSWLYLVIWVSACNDSRQEQAELLAKVEDAASSTETSPVVATPRTARAWKISPCPRTLMRPTPTRRAEPNRLPHRQPEPQGKVGQT